MGKKIHGGADFLGHTVETTPPLSTDGDLVEFDGTSGSKIKDGGLKHVDVADAITKKHTQNTDQYVDYGGANQSSAAEIHSAVSGSHAQNTDQYLDYGGTNQVSAADLHTTVDAQADLEAKKHSQNTDQYIDYGGANQKSAAEIKAAHDHISNTSNPHSVTAAQAGAIASAAGTLNALTEKTTLADNDLVLIEDSADSYTQKKAKKSNIGGSGGGASRRQTVLNSFKDILGRPDFMWSGVCDFATLRDTGDAISDSITGSRYAHLAFDGSDSTYWQSGTAYGSSSGTAYIGLKNLKRNILSIKYLNGAANAAVASVKVQYSTDDGLTWTDIQTTTVVATASTWNEFAVAEYASGDAGLHRIRLLANANPSGAAWTIYSLILQYENILDVTTTGNAVKYDEKASYPATNAFNNTIKTTGGYGYNSSTNMSTGNHYLGQSGLASAVKAVAIKSSGTEAVTHCAKEVRLSWKQNVGDSWTDLATVALNCESAQTWQTIVVPSYSPSGSHYFALRPTTNCGAATWWVDEMEFYLTTGNLNITANSTDKLHTTFGAGFSSSGATDYAVEVTADVTGVLTSPAAGRTHFVYQDRNSGTGALTYGSSPIVPQYGQAFDVTKHSLLHFDGADASTVMTDEFGHTWTASGNAQIETGGIGAKFGTGYLLLDGTTDYITNTSLAWNNGQPFAHEWWFYTADNTITNQTLFSTPLTYGMELAFTPANTIRFTASSNNSSANICNISIPYSISNNTWYKAIIEWDGYYYRIWLGTSTATMRCVLCVKSSTAIYTSAVAGVVLGASGGVSCLSGGIDEYRCTIGSSRHGWSPIAETAAFGKYDSDMHFYDTNLHKMYKGADASTWTEVQRVFLGEGYCDAQGFTSVINYALQGKYNTGRITTAAATTTKNHNIGTNEDVICTLQEGATINGRTQIMSKDFTVGRKSLAWSAVAGTSLVQVDRGW